MTGRKGAPSSTDKYTPERRRRIARARRREEQRWADMAGPVVVTTVEERSNMKPP